MNADKILVLKRGSLVEMGTHDELLQISDGVYKTLWHQQLRIDYLRRNLQAVTELDNDEEDDLAAANTVASQPGKAPSCATPSIKKKLSESFPSQNHYNTFDNCYDTAKPTSNSDNTGDSLSLDLSDSE